MTDNQGFLQSQELEQAVTAEIVALEPWLRLPSEPVRAYRAFAAYRDLGTQRSGPRVVAVSGEPQATVTRWMAQWQWAYRAEMFDRHVAKQAADNVARDHAAMLERHVSISMLLQQKAVERLKDINPDELTPLDVVRFLREAVKIERLTRGDPTEIIEQVEQQEQADISRDWYMGVLNVLSESGALPAGFDDATIASIIDAEAHEIHPAPADSEASSLPSDPSP